jgi:hypothetical protein
VNAIIKARIICSYFPTLRPAIPLSAEQCVVKNVSVACSSSIRVPHEYFDHTPTERSSVCHEAYSYQKNET